MSGTQHKHPTFGVCLCGHMDFMHPWTVGQRVDFQADCQVEVPVGHDEEGNIIRRRCECESFHADGGGES